MTTNTAQPEPATDHVLVNLRATLAAGLPGLSHSRLEDLAVRTHTELCERLGDALASNLASDQIAAFEQLVDDDADDDAVQAWFRTHAPHSKVTGACLRADLVAQVIKTVATAEPDSVEGTRRVGELTPISLDVIERWLREDEAECHRRDQTILIGLEKRANGLTMVISISLPDTPRGVLTLTGRTTDRDDAPTPTERQLRDFATAWNASTFLPKAVVRQSEESAPYLEGEISVPCLNWSTREQVIAIIAQSIDAIYAMADKLPTAAVESVDNPKKKMRKGLKR